MMAARKKMGRRGKWECKKCDAVFDLVKQLRQHRKEHRLKPDEIKYNYTYSKTEKTYSCNTCDSEAQTREEMERHVRSHEDTYVCQSCKSPFANAHGYALHLCPNSEDGAFKCPLCDFKTFRRPTIRKHVNAMHFNKFIYYCSFCGKGIDDVLNFREHEATHLLQGGKQFACVVCGKEFSFSRYLLTHQIRTHKANIEGIILPNQCPICKKNFAKRVSVDNHMLKHDLSLPLEKKHLCDICGKGFARKDKLKIHYRVHTGVKPYTCSYCAKSFIKRDYLIMHERIHSGEKPYACEYCGKCFNQGAPLRIHVRIHTGERPYVCHLCSAGFMSKGALNLHLKACSGV